MAKPYMIFKHSLWGLGLLLAFQACTPGNPDYQADAADPAYYHRSMKRLTDVAVHDIFSPPVASRIYVYPSIAAYEAIRHMDDDHQSLAGQLNGLESLPEPEAGMTYCYPLAGVHAFLLVGKELVFSADSIVEFHDRILGEMEDIQIPDEVMERSLAYGEALADHILAWADKDQYKETRTAPRFSLQDVPSRWEPTPPAYMDGIEPNWNKIRPMVLQGPDQFKPVPPTPFSLDKDSRFYKETMEVYEALEAEDREERIAIAKFWDCNPYVAHQVGHVMYATKKITPGGHWINITAVACRQADADILQTADAYVLTSIALFDGFISCWDEKYRSNLIRPETVINRHFDPEWLPALQTPPFPEYTSGHSVISRAAAIALTSIFGEDFPFLDDTEEEFGLPARSFKSFLEASEEAAVSRLYGGIHYRPAIDEGIKQGEQVGKYVVEQVDLHDQQISSR